MRLAGSVNIDRFAELFSLVTQYNMDWRAAESGINRRVVHFEIEPASEEFVAVAQELFPELIIS